MAYDTSKAATLGQLVDGLTRAKNYADAIVAALPEEFFLDQAKTVFVDSFAWSNTTYPGSTNPNLEGKPVLVLAVKNPDGSTVNYSFLNMLHLVDTYTAADASVVVSAKTIAAQLSAVTGNVLELKADGLYVPSSSAEIGAKADKVSGATNGDLAKLDSNGNLVDSGIPAANVLTTANVATDAEVNEALVAIFGATAGTYVAPSGD